MLLLLISKGCSLNNISTFREGRGTQHDIFKDVGQQLCEAFVAYNDGDFAKATDLLLPIRYKIVTIGGSNAQV